jgi:hypothetical protein
MDENEKNEKKSEGVKMVKLGDFLSQADINKAQKLYPDVKAICADVIKPQLEEINRKLGQENDPMYLAYAIIYAFESMGAREVES